MAKSTGSLILATVVSCLTMALCTGNSYLSILILGEMFQNAYRERGLAAKNLSRTLEDAGSRVLLVNDDKDTTAEAIDQLMEIGLGDLCYVPCYPGSPSHPEISTAITPGERACVPNHVTRIIDIGVRTLDIRTIYDLTRLLEAEQLLNRQLEELFGDSFRRVTEGSFVVPIRSRTVLLRIKALDDMDSAYLVTADYADTIQKLNRRIRQDSVSL